jgi:hypothetical protein
VNTGKHRAERLRIDGERADPCRWVAIADPLDRNLRHGNIPDIPIPISARVNKEL